VSKVKAYTLIKGFTFLVGVCLAALGTFWLFLAVSGAITPGATAGYVAGSGFLLVSAPLLAFSFSVRVARYLLVLALCALALGLLWSAFQPELPSNYPALVQLAAIAFAVLLVARVGLALRRKRSAQGT
jgi:hypothetical protein